MPHGAWLHTVLHIINTQCEYYQATLVVLLSNEQLYVLGTVLSIQGAETLPRW